jgi:hypothetical protein
VKSTRSFSVCPNCGAPTPDAYCPSCGQRNLDLHVSLRALVSEAIEELFGTDSRFGRTLRALFLRPGSLSLEYRSGRRAHYTSPIKLYLAASALFFLCVPGGAIQPMSLTLSEKGASVHVSKASELPREELPRVHAILRRLGWIGARAITQIDRLEASEPAVVAERKRTFSEDFASGLPRAFFFLLPVGALFLKLLYGRRRFLVDHVVFLLHTNTAIFFFDAVFGGPWIPRIALPYAYALRVCYSLGYTVIAMRTMYEQSWPRTVAKGALFLLAWTVVVVVGVLVLAAGELLLL